MIELSKKWIEPGTRVMDTAFLRDRYGNEYTKEALLIAMLFHTKNSRNEQNIKEVAKLLDDPNQSR